MGQIVDIPGQGQVEFPDGMSDEDIVKAIKKNSMAPQEKPSALSDIARSAVAGIPNAAANLVDLPLNLMNLAPYLASKIPPFPGNKPEAYQPVVKPVLGDLVRQGYGKLGLMHQPQTKAGQYAEKAVEGTLSLPTSRAMMVAGLGGGMGQVAGGDLGEQVAKQYGANPETGRKVGEFGGNLAGGLAMSRLLQPLNTTLTPEAKKIAEQAKAYGMELTPGQQTGNRRMLSAENTSESLPGGGYLAQVRSRNMAKANEMAINKMGGSGSELSPELLADRADKIGTMFDQATHGQSIKLGPKFYDAIKKVKADQSMLAQPVPEIQKMAEVWGAPFENGARSVTIPADVYQANASVLRTRMRNAFHGSTDTSTEVAKATRTILNALDDAAQTSLPKDKANLFTTARRQWSALEAVEGSNPAKTDWNINANSLASQLAKQNAKIGRVPTGSNELVDISRMKNILRDVTPNSGTPERAMWMNAMRGYGLTGLLGGGAGAVAGGAPGAMIGAGAAPFVIPSVFQRSIMAPGVNQWLSGSLAPSLERPSLSEQSLRALMMQQ